MRLKAEPADTLAGALMTNLLAAAGLTAIPDWVPVMPPVRVLAAVIDWAPAVFRVALNVPVPLLRRVRPGKAAWPSLLLKRTPSV